MLKKQNGITLVALVITIIVLLILAGVTIAMVVGDNGILTRSKQANFVNEKAKIQENVEMAVADLSADIAVKLSNNSFAGYTCKELCDIFTNTFGSNISKTAADDKYTIYIDDTAVDPAGSAKVLESTTAGSLKIEYQSTKLDNASKGTWATDTGKGKLSYTFNIAAGFKLGSINATAETNNGGY